MSVEAQSGTRGFGLRLRSEAERARAFEAAGRHTKLVQLLRKGLPAIAGIAVIGYFLSTGFTIEVGDMSASISGAQVKDGALRMTNPTLRGIDKKNGAYVVRAAYADQNVANPKQVELYTINAEVKNGSEWSRMTAKSGTFNNDKEELVMHEDIRVFTSSGLTGRLTTASVNFKNQLMRSSEPVIFQMERGTLRADTLTMRSDKKEIEFSGNVRVHLVKPPKDEASPGPAAPAPAMAGQAAGSSAAASPAGGGAR